VPLQAAAYSSESPLRENSDQQVAVGSVIVGEIAANRPHCPSPLFMMPLYQALTPKDKMHIPMNLKKTPVR
jgi:hypothetical protein